MARSGKSLFTRLYSGIEDKDILRDYGSGEKEDPNQDCTGTICELEHIDIDKIKPKWESQECMITVYFFSEEEIKAKVNDYLGKVYDKIGDGIFDGLGLPRKIDSLTVIKEKCSKSYAEKLEKELTNSGVSDGVIKGLVQYFRNPEYISILLSQSDDVMKYGLEIEKDKLRTYRDMTDNQCLYLAVKKIRIQVDMNKKHPGLFNDFIFVDTKGISTNAGEQSNKEAFLAINGSDAAFSIYFAKQGNEDQIGFYTEISNEYHLNKNFINKHFTIINRDSRVENVNTESIMNNIESKKLANTCYDGILKVADNKAKDVNYTEDDCIVFANLVILDMLNKIADYVLDFDQERINSYNQKGKQLSKQLGSLLTQLEGLKYERYEFSKELENKIPKLYEEIRKEINEKYKKELEFDSEKVTEETYQKSKSPDNCVYALITGSANEGKMSSVDQEIKSAISDLYKEWRDNAVIKYSLGTSSNTGQCVEYITKMLLERLKDGISSKTQSEKIDIRGLVDDLFNMIANKFKLKEILKEDDISKFFGENRSVSESMHNSFFVKLSSLYDELYATPFPPYKFLFTPWDVLKEYVSSAKDNEHPKYYEGVIIEDDTLKDCIEGKIKDQHLEDVFSAIKNAVNQAKHNCAGKVTSFFQHDQSSKDALYKFYIDHNAAGIILEDEKLSTRISLTEKWDAFVKLRQKYSELCKKGITEIPLYLIKSEEARTA